MMAGLKIERGTTDQLPAFIENKFAALVYPLDQWKWPLVQSITSSSTSESKYLVSLHLASFAKFQRNVPSKCKFPTKSEG